MAAGGARARWSFFQPGGTESTARSRSRCRFHANPGRILDVHGGNLLASACVFPDWAQHFPAEPCILQDGGTVTITGCLFSWTSGQLATVTGAGTRFQFSNNTTTNPQKIRIGAAVSAVVKDNNPALTVD